MRKLYVFLIIAIIVIIIIFILLNIKRCPKIDKPTVPFSMIRSKLKTGDVLAIHGCNLLKSSMLRKYLGCEATHVGMIVRKPSTMSGLPDELYVLELGPYSPMNPFRKSDARFKPLDQIMKESDHGVFGLMPVDKEIQLSDDEIADYMTYKFNYFVPSVFCPGGKYKICSSFVGQIHEDKGLIENSHLMSPCDYYRSKKMIFFTR